MLFTCFHPAMGCQCIRSYLVEDQPPANWSVANVDKFWTGVWDFCIARLVDDMFSLAETPRKITIHNPEGPYGAGKTDDKAYLHKRGGIYYLSWGCFYGMSNQVYGPYDCRGSIIQEQNVDPAHRYKDQVITYDRHGSFSNGVSSGITSATT